MNTSKSLLQRAKSDPESEAWLELLNIYEPLIAGWIARAGVENSEIGDISQEVLQALSQELPSFVHNGRTGAFRSWLKLITINRCRRYWDWKKRQVPVANEIKLDEGLKTLDQLSDPNSELSKIWDEEHDHYVVGKILEVVQHEFDPITSEIFSRYGLKGENASAVAAEMEVSVGQVYKAKFRVLERIRKEASDLINIQAVFGDDANETDSD